MKAWWKDLIFEINAMGFVCVCVGFVCFSFLPVV